MKVNAKMNTVKKICLLVLMFCVYLVYNVDLLEALGGTADNIHYAEECPPQDLILSSGNAGAIDMKNKNEFRAIWISYLDLPDMIQNKSEDEVKKNINIAFDNIRNMGLNNVIIQVRPFSDAIYKSDIFPQSNILTGVQGAGLKYDVFKIMVDIAHSKGLKVHAWINPFRIKNANSKFDLSPLNPANKWINANNTKNIINISSGLFYNPASPEVQKLIVDGVKEIVKNYDVDGIHLDDYFYPSTDSSIDKINYSEYLSNGGKLSLSDWRMNNVNTLIKTIFSETKKIKPNVKFGISPQGKIDLNYASQYSDVKTWMSNAGYVDYICPQIYWGFSHQTDKFDKVISQWNDLPKLGTVDLFVGLAAYKIRDIDKWALSGEKEWLESSDILSRQITNLRSNNNYKGFALFRYNNLFKPEPTKKDFVNSEIKNIIAVLKNGK